MDGGAAPDHDGVAGGDSLVTEIDYNSSGEDDDGKLTAAEKYYNENGYGVKKIVAMAIGLLNEAKDGPLIDVTKPPWTTLAKKEVKMTVADLRMEIARRAPADDIPRSANWNVNRLTKWLNDNPVSSVDDVLFIRKVVQSTIDECSQALAEGLAPTVASATTDTTALGQWRGNTPYLRLIMCLVVDDRIRNAYLHRGDAMSRTELDSRNSDEVREATVFEMIADKWNDVSFTPTVPVSTVHDDFRREIVITHDKVQSFLTRTFTFTNHPSLQVKHLIPATAIKVKNYLSSMRADLSRMIKNWELSGQGDGSLINDVGDDDPSPEDDGLSLPGAANTPTTPSAKPSFGQLENRTSAAMDSRANFLNGKPSYLLMFWELADKHQLLASTLQRLDRAAVAGAEVVQPVYKITRPSPSDSESNVGFDGALGKFSGEFHLQSDRQYNMTRQSDLMDSIRSYRVSMYRAPVEERPFWEGEIAALEKDYEAVTAELRNIDRRLHNKQY
jgi:hypothetical protein